MIPLFLWSRFAALRPLPHSSRETGRFGEARVRANARRGARLCLGLFSIGFPSQKSPRAVSHKNPGRQTWPPTPTPRLPLREYSPPSIPIRALLSTSAFSVFLCRSSFAGQQLRLARGLTRAPGCLHRVFPGSNRSSRRDSRHGLRL